MRFPTTFKRYKGGGSPVLGSDGAAGVPPTSTPLAQDNLLLSTGYSNQGWPAHRIAVAYKGPAAAIALAAQVWVYDNLSGAWYEVGAPQNITPNRITYFDVVALVDPPPTSANLGNPGSGGVQALLVVQDGVTPNGEYVFSMGADLTVLPI
jgi:hypothetical protein